MTEELPEAITRLNAALEGRYRIASEIGEGGMATVYLADDIKHEREVALKVMKPELAALVGAERFLAEIKTTANLQHPHILPLFDSGEADGYVFYVMPYVEGESLRGRLDREVQLPVEEAMRIATAVANAVGYAHRQGVIHRDIKPENVLMHEGEALVADFGIALAVTAAGGSRMTETGLSLGTPFYMSPEQASADRELGPQSDVYSVGCMLYEMLVGEPPHTGKTAQSVLAKILTERPRSVTDIRATVPMNVAAAVARSLERLPADRFKTAEEFVAALGDGAFTHELAAVTGPQAVSAATAAPPRARQSFARRLPLGVAAAALALAAWALRPAAPAPSPPTFRMGLSDFVVEPGFGWRIAISRDGRTIVAGGAGGLLYVRRSDDTEFRPIPGTEGATTASISPDGEWFAFFQNGALNKVQLLGGPVLPVVAEGGVPHWHTQDEIVYASGGTVYRVNSAGGTPMRIMEGIGPWPFMLPGGRGLLAEGPDGLYLNDLETGESTLIGPGGSNGRYVPTGHILYGDRMLQSVLAVPFDLQSLEVTGSPVPVLPSVTIFSGGAVQLAVSDNGTLVHGIATASGGGERFTWIEMDGTRTDLPLEAQQGAVNTARVSPDGLRLTYGVSGASDVFVYHFGTGALTEVTGDVSGYAPIWSADGSSLYFATPTALYRTTPDGSAAPVQVSSSFIGPIVAASPDGARVVVQDLTGEGQPNVLVARLDEEPFAPQPYLRGGWHEESGVISPEGNWLAYSSSEGGDHDIWIRAFPVPGSATRVSSEGGYDSTWAPDGSAIYYLDGAGSMMRRDVRLGETAEVGEQQRLFSVAGTSASHVFRMYDIHPDGDRFIFVTTGDVEQATVQEIQGIGPVVVVVNWFEELRRRMGGD